MPPVRGRWPHRLAVIGVPVVVSLSAAAAVLHRAAASTAHDVLPSYGLVPEFSLVDQAGRPFSRQQLQGQVWVADFIFTRCSGQCPLMAAELQRLGREFARAPSLRLVSISVDPQWDTPDVLARYAQAAGAKRGRWDFVTGDAAAITRLCREGFRLSGAPPAAPTGLPPRPPAGVPASVGGDGETMDFATHSTRLVLVDRGGRIRGYYESSDAEQLAQLRRDLARLLKESG
ncbi:MAG: SCO family protein [Candidatus Omnitrophica bacterium]|nr:SCO family protein [Candidatus Omnitrophota bacterium]